MGKILFLIQFFFVTQAIAQTTSSRNEYMCLQELSAYMSPRHYHQPQGHNSILYFLNEGYDVGMFSREYNPALLVIERDSVQLCGVSFNHENIVRFRVEDSSGTIKMAYNQSGPPHFRELSWYNSAPSRPCVDALGGSQSSRTREMLKKIILQALGRYLQQNGAQSSISMNCSSAAGITSYDLQQLRADMAQTPSSGSNSGSPATNGEDN